MEQTVVQVVILVFAELVIDLDGLFRCLLERDEVHKMAFCQSLLELHVVADSLDWGEVA